VCNPTIDFRDVSEMQHCNLSGAVLQKLSGQTKRKEKKFSFFATRQMSSRPYRNRPLIVEDGVQSRYSYREYSGGQSDAGICICSSISFYPFLV
jgi:hypothetical protein